MKEKIIVKHYTEYPNAEGVYKLEKEITIKDASTIAKIIELTNQRGK